MDESRARSISPLIKFGVPGAVIAALAAYWFWPQQPSAIAEAVPIRIVNVVTSNLAPKADSTVDVELDDYTSADTLNTYKIEYIVTSDTGVGETKDHVFCGGGSGKTCIKPDANESSISVKPGQNKFTFIIEAHDYTGKHKFTIKVTSQDSKSVRSDDAEAVPIIVGGQ